MKTSRCIGLILAAFLAAPAAAQNRPSCVTTVPTQFVERFADLPEAVRTDVLKDGKVAEHEEPFNSTDYNVDPNRPFRRFVLGGHSGDKWFLWLTYGGFAPHEDVLGFVQLWETTTSFEWRRSAEFRGAPCIAINAFLAGVRTSTTAQH